MLRAVLHARGALSAPKFLRAALPLPARAAALLRPLSTAGADAAAADAGAAAAAAAAAPPPSDASAALQAELAATQAKLKEALEARAYLAADIENVRRIARVDVERARAYAAQPIAKGLLLAVDNLAITTAAITPDMAGGHAGVKALAEGVGATLKIFLKVLGEHGVAQFGAPGERFNPNVHEAVAMVPAAPGQEANSVVAVLKVGYMFKDRVLRPAPVTVAMKAAAMEEAQAAVDATAGSSRSL